MKVKKPPYVVEAEMLLSQPTYLKDLVGWEKGIYPSKAKRAEYVMVMNEVLQEEQAF